MPLTKNRALEQFKEATLEVAQINGGKKRLTPDQKLLLEEDEAARLEVTLASEALELAIGTAEEPAALARLQKAKTLAPIRAKLAEPVRSIAFTPDESHVIRNRINRLRETKSAMAWFYSQDLAGEIDTFALLPQLRRAYALYRLSSNASQTWADWLEGVFPQPVRQDWKPLTNEAQEYLEDLLAREISAGEVTL